MSNGFARKEVAEVLGVSDRTVEEYISLKGELKTPAIRRLQGERKCTKMRKAKQ
jgi:predicted transcriptional regulator